MAIHHYLSIKFFRLTYKEFSEQTKKVREIKKLLQKIKEVIK